MKTLDWNTTAADVHENAIAHGWWEDDGVPGTMLHLLTTVARIALIITECSEAIEGIRDPNRGRSDKIEGFSAIEEELADVVIRVMDLTERRGYRIVEAIQAKIEYNRTRPFKHGGKSV